jgi:hypothetical protein
MTEVTKVDAQFSLDKVLLDGRHSPKGLIAPTDEDVLIIDQHTNDRGMVEYTKTVGVMKNSVNKDGFLEFDWVVTDPGLKELVNNADHPEKLFKYSPEFYPINETEEYDQGEYGKLKRIAITNIANDDDAITKRIINLIKNMITPEKDDGDNMDEAKVKELINGELSPIMERVEKIDQIEEALSKADFPKINEALEGLEKLGELPGKVEQLEKNMKDINAPLVQERDELVKNLKTNQDLISEESLVKMSIDDLRKLNQKYQKQPNGDFGTGSGPEDIVAQINAEYGTDVGASLNKD